MKKEYPPRVKLWVYYSTDHGYWRADMMKEDRAKKFQQTEKPLPYISWSEHQALLAVAVEALETFTHHYECDDPWYSCPESEGGCINDAVTECDCGAQRAIDALAKLKEADGSGKSGHPLSR